MSLADLRKDYSLAGLAEKDLAREIKRVERDMLAAAKNLEFERAAEYREKLKRLKQRLFIGTDR